MSEFVLDHVGIAVHDLDAARDTYSRLGFTLSTRSVHEGRATGNHCAMFREGYLELLGIARPGVPSSFDDMIARYQGIHIVAFGCKDAEQTFATLKTRHPGIASLDPLERDADFGPDGSETRRAAFSNIYTDAEHFPEAKYIFIEHLTPEVIWQPHLLDHPNGATGLVEVAICGTDVGETATRLSRVLDVPAEEKGPGFSAMDLERGRVYVLSADMVPKWAKGVDAPAVPSVVGFGVTVADLDQTKAHLDGNGVAYESHPYPAIWVAPEHANGAVLSFIQA